MIKNYCIAASLLAISTFTVLESKNNGGVLPVRRVGPRPTQLVFHGKSSQAKLVKKWETDATLKVPESVIYDKTANLLYVANINGVPNEADGNGFISKLSLSGKIENLEWVKGLDAPKGMAIFKDNLYVSDIKNLVIIDIKSGKVLKKVAVEGAKFLNDVTAGADGTIYVSDSDTKKVHIYKNGKISTWITGGTLAKPNGLLAEKNRVLVLDMGASKMFEYSLDGKNPKQLAEGINGADGIVEVGKDEYLCSNWNGEVYLVAGGKTTGLLDTKSDKLNAADIEYVAKDKLLLVPTFFGNKVVAYTFEN